MRKNLVWIASYPKSGNTWFRLLLSNYLSDTDDPVNINNINLGMIASTRRFIDMYGGVRSSLLTHDEVDNIRPLAYSFVSKESDDYIFLKVHDAYVINTNQVPLFPTATSYGVIYLMRNPLDVVISYAHHANISLDHAVTALNTDDFAIAGSDTIAGYQFRQMWKSWSAHVSSWVDQSDIPVHSIRYEDMLADTHEALVQALAFLHIDVDYAKVNTAVHNSSFKQLRSQEEEQGFKEKTPVSRNFFRKGQANAWKGVLSDEQHEAIVRKHGTLMARFGYLNGEDDALPPIK